MAKEASEYVQVEIRRAISVDGTVHRPQVDKNGRVTPTKAVIRRDVAARHTEAYVKILGDAKSPADKQQTASATK
ncbi:MAG TPA: hypothetical protein VMZ50_09195 [Phycisphaerae bacterium]|nr:hypothetical protein [Phycisphaerae bacterium]